MDGNDENRKKTYTEIYRKIFHILAGLCLVLLIYYDLAKAWEILLLLGVGIIISVISMYTDLPLIRYFLDAFEREHLRKTFPGKGVIYMLIGMLFLMITFEKNIVLAAMMIWTFGDSMSAIVGKTLGKVKHPWNDLRLIEGTLAGIIAATIAASAFVDWRYALAGSFVTLAIESMEWKLYKDTFDDNFFVPVIGAAVIFLCTTLF
jgi:dolichol kinase